jgi:hypothetical protein
MRAFDATLRFLATGGRTDVTVEQLYAASRPQLHRHGAQWRDLTHVRSAPIMEPVITTLRRRLSADHRWQHGGVSGTHEAQWTLTGGISYG